jgi:hypothetical protein
LTGLGLSASVVAVQINKALFATERRAASVDQKKEAKTCDGETDDLLHARQRIGDCSVPRRSVDCARLRRCASGMYLRRGERLMTLVYYGLRDGEIRCLQRAVA